MLLSDSSFIIYQRLCDFALSILQQKEIRRLFYLSRNWLRMLLKTMLDYFFQKEWA